MEAKTIRGIAAVVAGIHLIGVAATEWYVSTSIAGQAPMVWVYWAFVDFPFSLLYGVFGDSFLFVHGLLGTAWWYIVTSFAVRAVAALINSRVRSSGRGKA